MKLFLWNLQGKIIKGDQNTYEKELEANEYGDDMEGVAEDCER